jgi:orotate phosphoribosyltransferase
MEYKVELAKELLRIGAVVLRDTSNLFTWVSGIKSPIYCDNRLTISYPEVRKLIAKGFANEIEKNGGIDAVVGTATAGIPHAAYTSEILNIPMAYVRSSAKEHGKQNMIEGYLKKGSNVVVIEDLISTGLSSLKVVKALQDEGMNVIKVLSIFSYNFESAKEEFIKANVKYESLTDYDTLLRIAINEGYISSEQEELLKKWSKNPKIFTE